MPIYKVKAQDGKPRGVKATTKSVAVNHVIRDTVSAEVMTAEEVYEFTKAGGVIEEAAADQPDAPVTRSADVKAMDKTATAA